MQPFAVINLLSQTMAADEKNVFKKSEKLAHNPVVLLMRPMEVIINSATLVTGNRNVLSPSMATVGTLT